MANSVRQFVIESLHGFWERLRQMSLPLPVSIQYGDFIELKNNGELVPGTQYRITDYTCTTAQSDTNSAGHQFDIIVTANTETELSEIARAAHHEGDTYFENCDLDAWELKYCPENDTDRFAWADTTNGKGVIFYMKDEWNNIAPFDFKNILFTRNTSWFNSHQSWTTSILGSVPSTNMNFYFLSWVTQNNEIQDLSIVGQTLVNDEDTYNGVYNNEIKETTAYNMGMTEDAASTTFALPCTIIVSSYAYEDGVFYGCYGNTFGNNCGGNSFGNSCIGNTFGNDCWNNLFGNDCRRNSFGNSCQVNMFGNNCRNNLFGNSFFQNSFGNNCQSNSFGNSCTYNSFGNYCQSITVFNSVQNCSVTGGTSSSAPVKNAQILNGTTGTSSSNQLTITFTANQDYTQIAGLVNGTTLRIWIAEDTVTGPSSTVNERIAVFDGTTGKIIKDGGVTISDIQSGVPAYTIVKLGTAETGYIASYVLQKDGVQEGATINIPKDYLVKSGTVIDVVAWTDPGTGTTGYYDSTDTNHTNPLPVTAAGKYLDFVVNVASGTATDEHIYIAVNDLVDVYTEGDGIDISNTNEISIDIDSSSSNGLSVGADGLALSTATASSGGIGGSAGAMSAEDKEKLDGIDANIGSQILIPNFDEMTPVKTIEFDTTATSWYKLYSRPNDTDISLTDPDNGLDDLVLFRVTCTGNGIYSKHDFLVKFRNSKYSPYVIYTAETYSSTAATTGTYYLRFPYPKAINNGYDWICDLRSYNATARHYKIEVFATTENIEWVTERTASTFSSTYQTTYECECYTRTGLSLPSTTYVNITGTATSAGYPNSYVQKYINGSGLKAGQSIATYQMIYVSGGYVFGASNKNHAIDPELGIMASGSSYSVNGAIGPHSIRLTTFTADTELTYDTLMYGDKVYLRCRLEGDKLYSDGHLSNRMTPGYTWYQLGILYSATQIAFNSLGSMFITLDDNGMISHINGKPVNTTLLNGTYERLVQNEIASNINSIGSIKSVKGKSIVFNQIVPQITNSTTGWKAYSSGTVLSASDGVLSAYSPTGAASFGVLSDTGTISVIKGHLYYFSLLAKASVLMSVYYPYLSGTYCTPYIKYGDPQKLGTDWTKISGYFYCKASGNPSFGVRNYTTAVGSAATLYMKDAIMVDVTKLLGSGNEITDKEIYDEMFPLNFYEQNINGTLLLGKQTGFISKDPNNDTLTNLSIPVTTLTGMPSGSSVSEIIFPDGINGFGLENVGAKDEIDFDNGTAVKRIGCVDLGTLSWTRDTSGTYVSYYASLDVAAQRPTGWTNICNVLCQKFLNGSANDACGLTSGVKDVVGIRPDNGKVVVCPSASYSTASDFTTAVDGIYLLYVLSTPVEYVLDTVPNVEYETEKGGTEGWLPVNTSTPTVAPITSISSYKSTEFIPTQVQSNWNEADTTSPAYIQNKPTIPDVSGKADKVSGATNGNFAGLDSTGNLTDSGYKPSDFVQVLQVEDVMELTETQLNALRSGDIIVSIPGGQETLKTTWVVETCRSGNPQFYRELSISNISTTSLQTETVAHVNIRTIIYKSEFDQTSQQYEWDTLNPIVTNYSDMLANTMTVQDITNISSGVIDTLKCGDVVIEDGLDGTTNYMVTFKNDNSCTLTCFAVFNVKIVVYEKNLDVWSYAITTNCNIWDKADKILKQTSQPVGGMLPNTFYQYDLLSTDTTFLMAPATDNSIANVWWWKFTTSSTAITITWPAEITSWAAGSAPTINTNKSYEVSVMDGVACIIES